MLHLITATPGSGKTLFVIHTLKDIKDRPIYYHGIKELKLDWIELEDPSNWPEEVPDNAIVVIDEVQEVFPVRDFKKEKPLGVTALEKHRHRGIDLYFITQHPSMLDVHVRRLTGTHIHLSRKFGANRSTKYTGNEVFDPKNFHELKTCEKTMFSFPKKSFGLYKSAEVHTHKRHIPKFLYVIPVGLAVVGFMLYSIFDRFENEAGMTEVTKTELSGSLPAVMPGITSQKKEAVKAEDFKETITGVPGSAPVYADLWQPATVPKLSCISSADKCLCYTEQATRYFIDEMACRKRVKYGFYDFTKTEKKAKSNPAPVANQKQTINKSVASAGPRFASTSRTNSVIHNGPKSTQF